MQPLRYAENLKLFLELANESLYRLPLNNIKSIFGESEGLIPPYHPWSEYNLFHLHKKSPFSLQTHLLLHGLLFVLTKKYGMRHEDKYPNELTKKALEYSLHASQGAPRTENQVRIFSSTEGRTFPKEKWVYINGMFTNQLVAAMHGNYIASLFGRSVDIFFHPTQGWVMDVLECVKERIFGTSDRSENFMYKRIVGYATSKELKRIVILAHSQGNLILSKILKRLQKEYPELLDKIEVYTFANCANDMQHGAGQEKNPVPYLEHFANEKDIVCKVGILAEHARKRGEVNLDGAVFTRDTFGHLLNTHYLIGIENKSYFDIKGIQMPRLYSYLHGEKRLP